MKTLLMGALVALAPATGSASDGTNFDDKDIRTVAVSDQKRFDGLYGGVELGISGYLGPDSTEVYKGLALGYRWQMDNGLVFGVEGAVGDYSTDPDVLTLRDGTGDIFLQEFTDLEHSFDLKGTIGFTPGRNSRWLIFGEAGTRVTRETSTVHAFATDIQSARNYPTHWSSNEAHWLVGGGLEYGMSRKLTLRAKVDSLKDRNAWKQRVSLGLNYNF